MKSYEEIVAGYRKRQRDTLVDTIAAGLTYMDEIAVESGILEATGLLTEITGAACAALPFVVIAATESSKVILRKKPGVTALKDGGYRMVKSGVAMGMGVAMATSVGFWAALPATMGVRALFDSYKCKATTSRRVEGRIQRLKELNKMLRPDQGGEMEALEEKPLELPAQCPAT